MKLILPHDLERRVILKLFRSIYSALHPLQEWNSMQPVTESHWPVRNIIPLGEVF